MKINIKDLNINYIQYGEGKDIILLHGWGQNIEMMKPLGDYFCDRFRITILDLPGFGESDEPKNTWTIDDYELMLEDFIKELKIKKPIVIGHSFGGRVAVKYAANYDVEKFVIGNPLNMNGTESERSKLTQEFIHKLNSRFNTIPVIQVDERLTTVEAHRTMNDLNIKNRKKKDVVDTIAAVYILEQYLNSNS